MNTMNTGEPFTGTTIVGTRKEELLRLLQSGPRFSGEMARVINVKRASVRRMIQELRRAGHPISFASPNGVYCLEAR